MSKKTFMAAIAIFTLLLVGMQFVEVTKADSSDPNQPRLIVRSPDFLRTYNSNTIILRLEIEKPSSWFYSDVIHFSDTPGAYLSTWSSYWGKYLIRMSYCIGKIDYVQCSVDGNAPERYVVGDSEPNQYYADPSGLPKRLFFSRNLNLTEGKHNLKITVFGTLHKYNQPKTITIVNSSTIEIFFSIWYTNPKVSVASPASNVYAESSVPLSFQLDRPAVCFYCLDGAANVSLTGNTTLSGLVEGSHSLVVYAKDPAGNMGASDTVFFTVALPTPSPTQEMTLEPSQTPDRPTIGDFAPVIIPASMIFLAIVVLVVLVYFRKKRK